MSDTVKLLFGVHGHQPAGNFPEVIREARDRCYAPFLEVLDRHPAFPFALHVSGWLLDFITREFPDDIRRLRSMVDRGQVELFGGGDTEPVLAALSDIDRRSQLRAMNERLRRTFRARPRGAWLTERVWEATIVPALADSGVRYVPVDDYHFLCAGQPPDALRGYFATEENGRRLDLFPISEALRYKFPFAPARDAVAYLESLPPGEAAVYFDDIEKFGIWPETYDWVFGRRWLEDFIEGVLASPRIEPMRYDAYHRAHASRGIVYLPAVSYVEMGEWALPAIAAERFAQLVGRAKHEGTFERDKPYLRGGHWRNFLSRYPESNWMHKRAHDLSRRYHALPRGQCTEAMRADLHLAQANDAYWHGLFGGIYLPHLRRQIYGAIARLERALYEVAPRPAVELVDLDLDGAAEIILTNRRMIAAVVPSQGASVRELTHFGLAHNFCDTLARRPEHYIGKIRAGPAQQASDAPASIHDRVAFRTVISEDDLRVDERPRALFVDTWTDGAGATVALAYTEAPMRGGAVAFSGQAGGLTVAKGIRLVAGGVIASYVLTCDARIEGALVVSCDVSMPSCDGPGGAFVADGDRLGGLADVLALDERSRLDLADSELGGGLRFEWAPAARVDTRPLYTVSQSESGFEKIMQASTIVTTWRVALEPGEQRAFALRLRVTHR